MYGINGINLWKNRMIYILHLDMYVINLFKYIWIYVLIGSVEVIFPRYRSYEAVWEIESREVWRAENWKVETWRVEKSGEWRSAESRAIKRVRKEKLEEFEE